MINVNNMNQISFKSRIIDSHTHVGNWEKVDHSLSDIDVFVKTRLENGDVIEKMIVSNLDCIGIENVSDEIVGNTKMLNLIKHNPKYAALAVCQPNITGGNITNIEKLFSQNPNSFVGLKFHPKLSQLAADNLAYDNYLLFAHKHKLPCLFHSDRTFDMDYGFGNLNKRCEYSRPEQIYTLAKRYKDVPVILAHLGGNQGNNTKVAVDILIDSIENSTANMYADISWVNADTTEKPDIITAIKRLKNTSKGDKTDRLLFGTDAPLGRFCQTENNLTPKQSYEKVVNDVKNAIKQNFSQQEADILIEKIFYKNANDLFFSKKKVNFAKNILITAGILVPVISAFCAKITPKNKTDNNMFTSDNTKPALCIENNVFAKFNINN